MTYGTHREKTSDALSWLLSHPRTVPDDGWPELLAYRAAILVASQQLADRAVRGADVRLRLFPFHRQRPDIGNVVTSAPTVFVREIEDYPRLVPDALPLMSALSRESASPDLRAWAEAARHWTVASETLLDRVEWTRHPEQTWAVLADVTDVVEAISVLDRDVIARADQPAQSFWRSNDQLRLLARYVNMLSRSGGTDSGMDELRRREAVSGVVIIRDLRDLRPATERLMDLLERTALSARELRSFALVQADVARRCSRIISSDSDDGRQLRDSFTARYDAYRALAAATGRLGSVNRPQGRQVLAQLNEIGLAIGRYAESHAGRLLVRLPAFQVQQALVDRAVGRAVQRAVSSGSFLVVEDDRRELSWRRVAPGETPPVARAGMRLVTSTATDVGFAGLRLQVATADDPNPRPRSRADRSTALRRQLDQRPLRRPPAPNRVAGL